MSKYCSINMSIMHGKKWKSAPFLLFILMVVHVHGQGDASEPDDVAVSPLCGSYRLGLSALGFLAFLISLGQRASMSVAVVCMVNHTAVALLGDDGTMNITTDIETRHNLTSHSAGNGTVLGCESEEESSVMEDGPFVWTKTQQGQILSSFFIGYTIAQVPIGIIAERVSPKWVFIVCYGITTFCTMLTPVAAKTHFIFLLGMRSLAGVGTAATFPCMHAVLSRWCPPYERSRITGLTYSGVFGGGVVGMIVAGVLCQHGFSEGWDSIFYVLGGFGIFLWIGWMIIASSSPAENRFISMKEKLYIESQLKGQVKSGTTKGRLPVCEMLKSGPLWAIIAANFCADWGFYTLMTGIPTFLKEVYHFNIQSNGLISSLPFIGFFLNMYISPVIADKLMSSKICTPTTVRKIFNTLGMVLPAIFLIGLSFIDCNRTVLAVVLLVLAGTMSGCYACGYLINHIEIAPKFAGMLAGMTNGIAGTSGFIAPTLAAVLTSDGTRLQWQIVFFIASGILIFGAVIFCIFASAEIQPWAVEMDAIAEAEAESVKIVDMEMKANIGFEKPDLLHKNDTSLQNGHGSQEIFWIRKM